MTALTLRVTLSRVMMSCEGTSMASWRRETRRSGRGAEDEDHAGTGGVVAHAAEAEDDGALILLGILMELRNVEQEDEDDDEQRQVELRHGAQLSGERRGLPADVIVNALR